MAYGVLCSSLQPRATACRSRASASSAIDLLQCSHSPQLSADASLPSNSLSTVAVFECAPRSCSLRCSSACCSCTCLPCSLQSLSSSRLPAPSPLPAPSLPPTLPPFPSSTSSTSPKARFLWKMQQRLLLRRPRPSLSTAAAAQRTEREAGAVEASPVVVRRSERGAGMSK